MPSCYIIVTAGWHHFFAYVRCIIYMEMLTLNL